MNSNFSESDIKSQYSSFGNNASLQKLLKTKSTERFREETFEPSNDITLLKSSSKPFKESKFYDEIPMKVRPNSSISSDNLLINANILKASISTISQTSPYLSTARNFERSPNKLSTDTPDMSILDIIPIDELTVNDIETERKKFMMKNKSCIILKKT